MKPYLTPTAEYFDRAAVLPPIAKLWAEWPDLDLATARRVRAVVSSRDRQRRQLAFEMLTARAQVAAQVHR
jgi:hypothetical protein